VKYFAEKYAKKIGAISTKSMQKLAGRSWPGNVRELQHVVEKAVILCDGDTLSFEDTYIRNPGSPSGFNLEDHEKALIKKALEKNFGNISSTAAELGINRSTLYEKIRKYNIRQI